MKESYTEKDYDVTFDSSYYNKANEIIHLFKVKHMHSEGHNIFNYFPISQKVENKLIPYAYVPIEIRNLVRKKAEERGL